MATNNPCLFLRTNFDASKTCRTRLTHSYFDKCILHSESWRMTGLLRRLCLFSFWMVPEKSLKTFQPSAWRNLWTSNLRFLVRCWAGQSSPSNIRSPLGGKMILNIGKFKYENQFELLRSLYFNSFPNISWNSYWWRKRHLGTLRNICIGKWSYKSPVWQKHKIWPLGQSVDQKSWFKQIVCCKVYKVWRAFTKRKRKRQSWIYHWRRRRKSSI